MKEAVRFYDPVSNQPEKILIMEELKKRVRSSHALYKEHQEREKEEERKKEEDEERRKGILEEKEKEREKMVQRKESLNRSADFLKEEEMKAIKKLDTADELVKDGTAKLDTALARSPISESSVDAAKMMLQKGNATRAEAKEELEKIREKMNALDERKNKLLDQALRVQDGNCQKQKAREEKPAKKKGGIGKHQVKGESLG